jgi:L-aspartate oxidase
MGGVAVDARGRSSVAGLWAVGEVAATGLHGANRLASNSLLEALVFADRVAHDIQSVTPHRAGVRGTIRESQAGGVPDAVEADGWKRLRRLMSESMGVERRADSLQAALPGLRRMRAQAVSGALADAALVGELIVLAALRRRESRGGHCRLDCPDSVPAMNRRNVLTLHDVAPLPGEPWGNRETLKELVS